MSGLPAGWDSCQLNECLDILDKKRVPINNKERNNRLAGKSSDELYPYYGATGQVGYIDDYIFDEELVALGEDGVPFFDTFKNKAYLLKGKTWVNNHAHVLKGLGGIPNKYICYYFNQFDYHGYVNGATRLKLTQANMKRMPVLLAPLNEQIRIANKLDSLLGKLQATQKRLDKIPTLLKRYRQSVLAAAVSGELTKEWRKINGNNKWKQKKLSDLVEAIEAGKSIKCIERPPEKKEYGIIKISAVTWGIYNENESKTLFDKSIFLENRRVRVGDFLISRANTIELLGTPVIVENVTKNLMLSDKVLRLVMDESEKEWINIFLRSHKGRKEIETRATGNQHSMRNIGQKLLLNIDLPYPQNPEKKQIVKRVEALFKLADQAEQHYQAAKQRSDKLTQSILAKAFRGELVPQDPNDEPASELLARIQAEKDK